MFFNSQDVEVMDDFEVLPAGNYRVAVESVEMKVTKAQTGRYVAVVLEVISGTGQGRKIFSNFNIENPNEQATKIGKSDFAKFLKSIGVALVASEADLIKLTGKTAAIEVSIKTAKNGAAENKVKYLDQTANQVTTTVARSSAQGMNQPVTTGYAQTQTAPLGQAPVYDAAGNVVPF